jgi:hypothetical protein
MMLASDPTRHRPLRTSVRLPFQAACTFELKRDGTVAVSRAYPSQVIGRGAHAQLLQAYDHHRREFIALCHTRGIEVTVPNWEAE